MCSLTDKLSTKGKNNNDSDLVLVEFISQAERRRMDVEREYGAELTEL